jgi:ABC-type glycerol-3-phosphate transport system substrate-binding protein
MTVRKKIISLGLVAAMVMSLVACGKSNNKTETASEVEKSTVTAEIPTIDSITLGEDYQELEASIKVLTNRTDIVDTVYKGYAEEFMQLYPNIKVDYEAVTDYEQSLNLRLTVGDWGDICFIPTSVNKSDLSEYFTSFGDYETLNEIYNFCADKTFGGQQYGIANGGTAGGVVFNKKVWEAAGITEKPSTPDEFIDCLKQIKDKTDAVPLYTNFAAGWTMGQWDSYIGISATGNPDFMNDIVHMKDPFAKKDDMTGPYAVYYTLYEAVKNGLVEEDPASSDWESSKSKMNTGEIGTMVLGSWAVQQCKDAGENADDVAYMPFPITVNGKQYAGAGGNYSFGINNKATNENQIAAMLYVKWLIEESSIYVDEGSIPALKSQELPETLADFKGVEMLANNPAKAGEENLFEDVNNESEVGINKDDYPKCEILEYALYGTKTLDEIMAEWNAKWSAAQETLGVEITE